MITLHVVSSLDGFIAKPDNTVSWLESSGDVYEKGVSEDDAEGVVQTIDCFVLGSHTYEHALQLGWPYGDTPVIVLTNRELPSKSDSVEFYSGDLKRLIDETLVPRYRSIWLVGGAMVCQSFLQLGLVDEIRLAIAPVLLGDGLRLFGSSGAEERWQLKNVIAYKNGFVELSYLNGRRTTLLQPRAVKSMLNLDARLQSDPSSAGTDSQTSDTSTTPQVS